MIDTNKVRLMAKTAAYENGPGKKDIRINRYKRSTYVTIKVIESLFFITIAFLCAAAMFCARYISTAITKGIGIMRTPLFYIGVSYVILMIISWILTARFYSEKYTRAHKRIIHYDRNLAKIERYIKENPKEVFTNQLED